MNVSFLPATALVGVFLAVSGCQTTSEPDLPAHTGTLYQSDFRTSNDGWVADVTDYSTQQASLIEFKSDWTGLPKPLDTNRKSMMVSSHNRSDDVFMFLKRRLTGLAPNTEYKLVFDLELASAYATNSIGIGGSPGSSVILKAGATTVEPAKLLKDGFYELNIDKGAQSNGGKDVVLMGHIGAGNDVTEYKLITRSNAENPLVVRTGATGELWLVVGTDSGFEGQTTLYYSNITVTAK